MWALQAPASVNVTSLFQSAAQSHHILLFWIIKGDMYESTVDVPYHMYEKVSIGGFVIMDDWQTFPSKIAREDFCKVVHGIWR